MQAGADEIDVDILQQPVIGLHVGGNRHIAMNPDIAQILHILMLLRPEIDRLVMLLQQGEQRPILFRRRPVIGHGEDGMARLAGRDLPAMLAVQHPHGRAGRIDHIRHDLAQMLIGVQIAHRMEEGRRQHRAEEQARRQIGGTAAILLPANAEQHDIAPRQIIERRDLPIAADQHVRLQDIGPADDRQSGLAAFRHLGQRRAAMRWRTDIIAVGEKGTDRVPYGIHDEMVAQIVALDAGIEHINQHQLPAPISTLVTISSPRAPGSTEISGRRPAMARRSSSLPNQ